MQGKEGVAWFIDKKPHSQIDAYEEEKLNLQSEEGFGNKQAWFDKEDIKINVDITIVNGLKKLRSIEL